MSKGVNKVIILGNLGLDPEVRHTPGGLKVVTIRVATSDTKKDKSGKTTTTTEWHEISFWGKLADVAETYLKTGSRVYIEGKLQTSRWKDKNNVERSKITILGKELQMLDSRTDKGNEHRQIGLPDTELNDDDIPF